MIAAIVALPLLASFNLASADPNGSVSATVKRNQDSVVVQLSNGKASVEDGKLVIRNNAGKVYEQYPLTFIAPDNRTYPIDASVKGNTATLVPSKNVARSTKTDPALLGKTQAADRNGYKSKKERDDAALSRLNQELSAGGTISALVGTAIGAVIGALGVGTMCALSVVGLPAIVLCIPIGAAVGGIIGTVVIGGPAAIVSIVRYFDTINAPFKHVR